jgi:DNA mismatch endonuclease (patch repair protein)
MLAVRRRDTDIELRLRSILHAQGLRYYVDRSPLSGWRRRADLVFPRARVAVFVDSCFWHGCPEHGTWPKSNARWWRDKIEANRARDRDTDRRLAEAGWLSIRVWGHENASDGAFRVSRAVRDRSSTA